MVVPIEVDGLLFRFQEGWKIGKYDEWNFYRHQLEKRLKSWKAVDLVAVDPSGETAYLIEVKDYSGPESQKPSQLPESVALKVLHTLAALLPAKLNANDNDEKALATAFLKCRSLKVVLHADNPLHKQVIDPADLKQKLKRLLKAVDPRVQVSSRQNPGVVPWEVTSSQA